jgi:uncharacterized protein
MISEQPVVIDVAEQLTLEGRLAVPASPRGGIVICHPHPLYGGDMDNPVVVRVQEVCAELDLVTLRFNFRGIGSSTGNHANGIGEQDDAVAALDVLAKTVSGRPLTLAGYSFGARIAALVAGRDTRLSGLALVAPPLKMYDFGGLEGRPLPTLMVAGTADAYCPTDEFRKLGARFPWIETASVEGADHFFFGKLFPLGQAVAEWTRRQFPERGAG